MKMELYILQFTIFIYAHKLPTPALNVFYNDFETSLYGYVHFII